MTPAQVAHIMALVDQYAQLEHAALHYDDCEQPARKARAAVEAALRNAPQAEGWVMVPVEPTWDMQMAASSNYREPRDGHYTARMECAADAYRAMIAARPSAPTAVEPPYPMATTLEGAAQDVAKWLNERPNSPLDLRHVAMLVHAVQASATAVEPEEPTEAYAQGRGDQFEDDSAVIRLLLENCDDADQYGDGQMNTTRIRELLTHFEARASKGTPL